MFSERWANRAIEVAFGFQTGITPHTWFLHHAVGHHVNDMDQSKGESRWVRRDGSVMGEDQCARAITATA